MNTTSNELCVFLVTAASIGFFHTLLGPDHYLPFIVMGRARQWAMPKIAMLTFLCGLGHVLGSVVLGAIGVAVGIAIGKLEGVESVRGNVAAWLLIGFGLAYAVWGMRHALNRKPHVHVHIHPDGSKHEHEHEHVHGHSHVHAEGKGRFLTPWILFTIFVFGPCEPLIPILMYPAAKNSILGLILVTAVFGLVTIGTMLGVVMVASLGINFARLGKLEQYSHALAGAAIFLSGMAIQFLGL